MGVRAHGTLNAPNPLGALSEPVPCGDHVTKAVCVKLRQLFDLLGRGRREPPESILEALDKHLSVLPVVVGKRFLKASKRGRQVDPVR